MWDNYIVGEKRVVTVSRELYEAAFRYHQKYKRSYQGIFDQALIMLWRIWNGYTETNDSCGTVAEMKVRNILNHHPMPGIINMKTNDKKHMVIGFKGEKTFDWMCDLERLSFFHSTGDGIRRIITWFLTENGYLKKIVDENIKDTKTDETG